MGKKIRVKPSKAQSTAAFFVGIVFCLIGLFVAIPMAGPFGYFGPLQSYLVMHGKYLLLKRFQLMK